MKLGKSGQNVSDNAVRSQEMKAEPVYEDVENSSPNQKDNIRWTTTSLYSEGETEEARD